MPEYYVTISPTLETSKTAYAKNSAQKSYWSASFQPLPDAPTSHAEAKKNASAVSARRSRTGRVKHRKG